MNQRSDTDRLLRHWFEDGPTVMPDRVVHVVADRIARQPQRRAWRLRGRPFMNTYAKLVAAAAAIVIVGFVGWQLLPGYVGPGRQPSAVPTASPTATPAASPSNTTKPTGVLMRPIAGNSFTWEVMVPDGWITAGNWYLYPTRLGGPEAPDGIAVAFVNVPEVFVNSCDSGTMSDTSSVAELVAAIQAKDDWTVSTPVDVTISGFAGQRLDVALPADLSVCGGDNYLVFGEPGTGNGFYAQGPSQLLRVWLLDVEGRIVLLARESFAASPAKELAEAQPIIESSVLTP